MNIVQQPQEHTKWEKFKSLGWYDGFLAFIFRFTAISSELMLAFGVVLATANHLMHGVLFSTVVHGHVVDTTLFQVWAWTQAVGFEASAGIVLFMALDANRNNDIVKRRVLIWLMIGLALVGTVMLFMSYVESSVGIQESQLPWQYNATMAFLRSIVSVAYIIVGRVKGVRFSGDPILQQIVEVPDVYAKLEGIELALNQFNRLVYSQVQSVVHEVVQSQIQQATSELGRMVHTTINSQLEDMSESVQQLPLLVQQEVRLLVQENVQPLLRDQAQTVAQLLENDNHSMTMRQLEQRMQEVSSSVKEMNTTITEVRTISHINAPKPSPVARTFEPPKVVQSLPVKVDNELDSEPVGDRVRRFISDQIELGRTPSLNEIMNQCKCSKNTAIKCRRELLPDESELAG